MKIIPRSEFPAPTPHEAATTTSPYREQAASRRIATGIFLLGALTAAVYSFVIYAHQNLVSGIIDLNGFGNLGRHVARGDGFSLGFGPTLRRAPLYPMLVAAVLRITGTVGSDAHVYLPVQVLQCLLVGGSCACSYLVGRRLFGLRAGVLAGVLCAFTPQVLRYAPMTEVETLMGFLIVLTVLTGMRLADAPTPLNGAIFGVVNAAAALTKPVALLYLPLFLVLLPVLRRTASPARKLTTPDAILSNPIGRRTASRARKPWSASIAALVCMVLCLLPWVVRNYIVSDGRFLGISSNGPGEYLRGFVNAQPKFAFLKQDFGGSDPGAKQWDWEANLMEDRLLQQHGMRFFTVMPDGALMPMEARVDLEIAKDHIESQAATQITLTHPGNAVRKFIVQIFTFWYLVETRKKSLMVGGLALAALLFAVIGVRAALRRGINVLPVVSVVIYYNLLYAAILAFARYSMPLYPALMPLSAFGLLSLGDGTTDRPDRPKGDIHVDRS